MSAITVQGESTTLVLNGRAITQFGEGDYLELTPENPATSQIPSASGGVNINEHLGADIYTLTVRVQRFGEDDQWLQQQRNQDQPVVFNGSLKENFTRDGSGGIESWTLENGSFSTQPTATKNNTDGNALMEYQILFRRGRRNL